MKSYVVLIGVAFLVVILAVTIPLLLLSGDEAENPHTDEELARLSAQMAVDYDNQKAAYNDLLQANPDDYVALNGLAQVALIEGDYPTAVKHLTRAIEIKTDDPYLYMLLAEAYYKMQLTDKAIVAVEQAVALAPNSQDILLNAGYIYDQAEGKEEQARQYWQRAYDVDPNSETGKNAYHALNPDIPLEQTATTDNPHQ
ncbi:MAG: tetratricopeptide repeat protein [Thermoleophilia bacterium]